MRQPKGFGLIEIVIASAVISVALISLSLVFVLANRLTMRATEQVRANFIAEEGIEVMRFLRDKSWSTHLESLTAGVDYYISFNPATSAWSITTTNPGLIDQTFQRIIRVSAVQRDASDDIVTSGGSIDSDTFKITSIVSWDIAESINVETYLSNIYEN